MLTTDPPCCVFFAVCVAFPDVRVSHIPYLSVSTPIQSAQLHSPLFVAMKSTCGKSTQRHLTVNLTAEQHKHANTQAKMLSKATGELVIHVSLGNERHRA